MENTTLKQRLKTKWGIETESQFMRIMVMFTLAGSSCVLVRKPIFLALDITSATPAYIWWTAWLLVIFPSYQLFLLLYGKLLGIFPFAWWFEKKMLRRLRLYHKPEEGPPKLS